MTQKIWTILILCTGNSARSIMAEALINSLGQGRFRAFSAGSQPTGTVNPFALEQLRSLDYPAATVRSKSWEEFAKTDAPKMDMIITVCDNAAGETCPLWPGHPVCAHWGFADPAAVQGSDVEKRLAFEDTFAQIARRVRQLVALPPETLDSAGLGRALAAIGDMATEGTAP